VLPLSYAADGLQRVTATPGWSAALLVDLAVVSGSSWWGWGSPR